jgi:hypothetical protein
LRLYEAGPPGVKHFVIKILQLQRTPEIIAFFKPLTGVENLPVTRLAVKDLSGWSKTPAGAQRPSARPPPPGSRKNRRSFNSLIRFYQQRVMVNEVETRTCETE